VTSEGRGGEGSPPWAPARVATVGPRSHGERGTTTGVGARSLVLVRHGQTDWNVEGRYQGHTDVPLNETGRMQARALGARLRSLRTTRALFDPARTAVLSSDLRRATETATLAFGVEGRRLHVDAGLREIGFGAFEGLTEEHADARFPGSLAAWHHGDAHVALPGGETRAQASARALAVIGAFAERTEATSVVVVTHGAVLRLLVATCFEGGAIPWRVAFPNTVAHRVRLDGARWSYERALLPEWLRDLRDHARRDSR